MPSALKPGETLGKRFVIEAAAGSGGMGTVYRGRDVVSGARVALKLLNATVGGVDEAERFAREVEILAELRHPGIVSYVAHGVSEAGHPYLVMEWLEGEDLSRRLRRGALSPRDSLTLIERIADALYAAHQRRIVHRGRSFKRANAAKYSLIRDFRRCA
jgi:serine/threonine protein kinase